MKTPIVILSLIIAIAGISGLSILCGTLVCKEDQTVTLEGRCIWNSEYRVHRCDYVTTQTFTVYKGGVWSLDNVRCPKCLSEMVWYGERTRLVNTDDYYILEDN